MEFIRLKRALQAHTTAMLERQNQLYIAGVEKDQLWETYLRSSIIPSGMAMSIEELGLELEEA